MIKLKSGIKVYDFISFRKHFNLEEMLPLAMQVSKDVDLFINDEVLRETQGYLRRIVESKSHWFPLSIDDGKVVLDIGTERYEVIHTQAETFCSENYLGREDAIALLISELGGRPYSFSPSNNGNDSLKDSEVSSAAGSLTDPLISSPVILEENRILRLPQYNHSRVDSESIEIIAIQNHTAKGYTRVIIETNDSDGLEYKLDSQTTMFLLKINGTYLNKLPQLSVSMNHADYLSYSGDVVEVRCKSLNHKNDTLSPHNPISHRFGALALTQVCADERGGFIALVNGEIIAYSTDIQPDVVEDMMMDIPADEKIVMIQLAGRQIFALTDKKRVYSNCPCKIEDNGQIVWLDKSDSGEIMAVSEKNFKQPKNVDKRSLGSTVISYNNGKIS